MKRLFTLIVAISAIFAAMAQNPMATVSHNGELTQFTGLHALDEAINSSVEGDIIYLSEGTFSSGNMEKWVRYGISIIGSGYGTKILGKIIVGGGEMGNYTKNNPLLDGVYLHELDFTNGWEDRGVREFLEIRNSWIDIVYAGNASKEFLINGCYIGSIDFSYIEQNDIYVNNSKIKQMDREEYVQLTNCNVEKAHACPRILISSIISEAVEGKLKTYDNGTHFIYNSLFPSEEFVNESPESTILNNCYFENPANGLLDENLNCTIDLAAKGYLGQDGTIIGAHGGEKPFSENPSVPTIDSEKSSVEYDAASKKLNVTITVAND